jgi:lipid-A-disaccharide synthase-like uncharacterized protein
MSQWWQNFLLKLDWWSAVGLLGQSCFAIRWVIQWLKSERAGATVVPPVFWYLSLMGAILVTLSGILKEEAVIIAGGLPGLFLFSRNLVLLKRPKSGEA